MCLAGINFILSWIKGTGRSGDRQSPKMLDRVTLFSIKPDDSLRKAGPGYGHIQEKNKAQTSPLSKVPGDQPSGSPALLLLPVVRPLLPPPGGIMSGDPQRGGARPGGRLWLRAELPESPRSLSGNLGNRSYRLDGGDRRLIPQGGG